MMVKKIVILIALLIGLGFLIVPYDELLFYKMRQNVNFSSEPLEKNIVVHKKIKLRKIDMVTLVLLLSLAGITISLYGIMIEKKVKENELYRATCDISDTISCTRTFLSPYNKIVGISNIWASLFYYCAVIIFALINATTLVFLACCAGFVASLIFAYILFFKVRTICLICISLYIINTALVVVAYPLL